MIFYVTQTVGDDGRLQLCLYTVYLHPQCPSGQIMTENIAMTSICIIISCVVIRPMRATLNKPLKQNKICLIKDNAWIMKFRFFTTSTDTNMKIW